MTKKIKQNNNIIYSKIEIEYHNNFSRKVFTHNIMIQIKLEF